MVIYKLLTFFIIIKLLIFLFLFIIFILWISQCGFNILYKLDRQKLPKKLFSVYGNFGILIFMNIAWMVVVLWIFFDIRYVFFYFQDVIWRLWLKKTSKRTLSKLVQQVLKFLNINFHESSLNGYGVMDFFVMILKYVLLFSFQDEIWRLWLKKTSKRTLSKLVQQVLKFLNMSLVWMVVELWMFLVMILRCGLNKNFYNFIVLYFVIKCK